MATAKSKNKQLEDAKAAKQDEWYTRIEDIQSELSRYRDRFKGKVVYGNCDDPRVSNFFRYFSLNFEKLGLKKLITTCYRSQTPDLFSENASEEAIWLEYLGDKDGDRVPDPSEIGIRPLRGDGDFRSPESIELLKQADIVATNPPFSLFREFVAQLFEHNKQFIVIGPKSSITYKDVFPLIKDGKMWVGARSMNDDFLFDVPDRVAEALVASGVRTKWRERDGVIYARSAAIWLTNLDFPERHEDLLLYKTYNADEYPTYANFDAIEVGKTSDIPQDYDGLMGVPTTFLNKYNPEQFEIVGNSIELARPMSTIAKKGSYSPGGPRFYLPRGDGTYRRLWDRLVIRSKRL